MESNTKGHAFSRRKPTKPTVYSIAVLVAVMMAVPALVAVTSPRSLPTPVSRLTFARIPGDLVSISCNGGTISIGSGQVCNNQVVSNYPLCGTSGTCTFTVSATVGTGTTFKNMVTTGDFCFGTYPTCGSTTTQKSSVAAWAGGCNSCGGSLTLNGVVIPPPPPCPSVVISAVTTRATAVAAWVNWSDSPANSSDSFTYGTSPTNLNGGGTWTGPHGVYLTALSNETTYYYQIWAQTSGWCSPQTHSTSTGSFYTQSIFSYFSPYGSGYQSSFTNGIGGSIGASSATPSNGYAFADASCSVVIIGACGAQATVGFDSSFTPNYPGSFLVIYKWQLWWNAGLQTSFDIIPSSNSANGTVGVEANVYDLTSGHSLITPGVTSIVWSGHSNTGLGTGAWSGSGQVVTIAFYVSLGTVHTYQFNTWFWGNVGAGAIIAINAYAHTNIGTGGDFGQLDWVHLYYV